ncbi:hypothetical protein X271_00391 [Candidatus Hepatoplasma crinochetorum Av]|uniref:Uncharacterized protein n=1 Tax=Candidatus Hepatoplasma crinochetorum Av TaxID=1427984 RepID=W8GNA0_9MOLU|nr:hypothetical protein X271_00391 [Candidatus Hepatoplasma crinochetorum Av]
MTILNKSFYRKYKMDKLNKDYNEKLVLFNIQKNSKNFIE